MAESSGSSETGNASAGTGISAGSLGDIPSPKRGMDLGAFIEQHTKVENYNFKKLNAKPYDRLPLNYQLPSYGRQAIGLYAAKTILRPYRTSSLYSSSGFYNRGSNRVSNGESSSSQKISYKQASKYNVN